jgi:hypothetical protein
LNIVYVGETGNERQRLLAYASRGSHRAKLIDWHLREDWHLYCRAQAKNSKEEAVRMQNSLLAAYEYDWNVQLNKAVPV